MVRRYAMKVPKPRKLPSGSWFIQLRLGGESVPITALTEKDCVRQAEYAKSQYRMGLRAPKQPEPSPALSEVIDRYIAKRDAVLSPSTVRSYNIIRQNRFQAAMNCPIDTIDWQQLINRESALCAPKTLKNAWRLVASAVGEATGAAPKAVLPQIAPNERPFLDPQQVTAFIAAVKDTDIAIPAMLGLCSLRRSELLALRWENVDLKRKTIHVSGAAVPGSDNMLVYRKENKNSTSNRIVPIMIPELHAALSASQKPSGLVVTTPPKTLWAKINRICAANGLPQVGVHGLRHSFVSLCYHLDVPEKIVMEIGGWKDYATMRKIYTHIAQYDIARHTSAIEQFFAADQIH